MTVNGRLLILLADYLDFHERIVSVPKTLRWLAGDPRCVRHRRWVEEYLEQREKLYQAAHNLKRRGYLQEKVFRGKRGFILTPKSETRLLQLRVREAAGQKRLAGDQWLMTFFDIPESLKREREILRANLRMLGFEQLQKSVWATRNDVRAKLRTFLKVRQLDRYVKLLIVKELG